MTRASQRPENHDPQKAAPRAQTIQQPAAAEIHQAVGDEKRGIEGGLDLIADGDVRLNGLDRPDS